MSKNIHLLVIDPQNSFAKKVPEDQQQTIHDGELCVKGAWEDMERVAAMIDRIGHLFDQITVTLDSHHQFHIAHPLWWKDGKGQRPKPFTTMREEKGTIIGGMYDASGTLHDVGEYMVSRPMYLKHTINYLRELAAKGRYSHMVWPNHCLIGTPGFLIVKPLRQALLKWENEQVSLVHKVTKGSTFWTEHFSAVQAEVPHPDCPETQRNPYFIDDIATADEIVLAGEASSHCVLSTLRDMADFADDSFIQKVVCLENAMSPVEPFEQQATDFFDDMQKRGMQVSTTEKYLAA